MFRPSASVAVIFFFGRIHMISGECPKYEALLHNFKPMYYIDHRETIQMWAKVIPERWQDNRLINAVIRLKNKLPGNINRLMLFIIVLFVLCARKGLCLGWG
ncbi:uncharacterized protein LOC141889090 isoform X3 [Acropora palmata]|uniref:uncharacterized protein LOC141889090 isoform X3 n=1 Tax=Acropora palmata TaxID=6131 RepID=UPI003DA13388